MGDVVNLRMARKARKRTQRATAATENRAIHGRTKSDRNRQQLEQRRDAALLDGAKLDRRETD
ncbi:MAG: DUF4169 family protein [Novosphingobium sp.]|nr:DUF4169 family protein [Novosphingobium sp.]